MLTKSSTRRAAGRSYWKIPKQYVYSKAIFWRSCGVVLEGERLLKLKKNLQAPSSRLQSVQDEEKV